MAAEGNAQARLFLSYSRRNAAFVDELIISLESYEFDVLIDREDLFPGEAWEPRLQRFIADADTTVCVVSTEWVSSDQCVREMRIALDNGRRVIPVVVDQIAPAQMPAEIARLQLVFFVGAGRSYARAVADLVNALRTDIEWVREQSRLLDKAQEWAGTDRASAVLLRGAALERALHWLQIQKPGHTHVLPIVAEFVGASRREEDDNEKKRLRSRVLLVALAGVAVAGTLGSAVLYFQRDAANARANLDVAVDLTEAASQSSGDPAAVPPGPSVPESSPVGSSPVAELNSPDAATRLRAGQSVAEAIRGARDPAILKDLVAELTIPRLEALTASGRFNVLYMLNVYDAWPGSSQADALREALKTIEGRAQGENPLAIGGQTRDCIEKLSAKLRSVAGVSNRCGGR